MKDKTRFTLVGPLGPLAIFNRRPNNDWMMKILDVETWTSSDVGPDVGPLEMLLRQDDIQEGLAWTMKALKKLWLNLRIDVK